MNMALDLPPTIASAGSPEALCASGASSASSASSASAASNPSGASALIGLARLMKMAFDGGSLTPLAATLIVRASADANDADALMDLSTVLQLQGLRELGLATLGQALQASRRYELAAAREPALRLLAIMTSGDLMANMPLSFLIEDSDIALSMLYLLPGEPLPTTLPEHDAVFIGACEADAARPLLRQLDAHSAAWPKPVFNRPGAVMLTSREHAYAVLEGAPGIAMPASARLARDELHLLAATGLPTFGVLADAAFPLIVRPVDSHAGHGLAKVDSAAEIVAYLAVSPHDEFFVSSFIDYRSRDGLFRKYRIVIVDGAPFAGHLAISSHWMIHYLNAGMADSAAKRTEEADFMTGFDTGFGQRHAAALASLAGRFELDYLVIDCAETASGELLVFEVDPGAVVHSMDPVDLFAYKQPAMQKVFAAFREMLLRGSARAC